jgi:hypothetical protein
VKNLFFSFRNVEEEIKKKNLSLKTHPDILFTSFLKKIKFTSQEKQNLSFFYEKLKKYNFDRIYKNYLSHPIRLAEMYKNTFKDTNISDLKFVLSHNIIENYFFNSFKNNLNAEQINKIKILTIDRNRQKNKKYLELYYNNIEKYSSKLLVFKALDKLDNALIGKKYLFNNNTIDVLNKYLLIKLSNHNTKLYLYFVKLLNYAKKNII